MVNEDFSTKQSSFLLSEKQRKNLIDPSEKNEAAIEKRNKLPELITRLVEDMILYEDAMLLPPDSEEEVWADLSDRLSNDEDYLDDYQTQTTSYELGANLGLALGMMIPDDQVYKRDLVRGLVSGSLGRFEFTDDTGIKNLNEIHRSVENTFIQYQQDIIFALDAFEEASESLPEDLINEMNEQNIEITGGASEMVLRRLGSDSLNTSSDIVESILNESPIREFDKLADHMQTDMPELKKVEYNNTSALDVLKRIWEQEDTERRNYSSSHLSEFLRGIDKNTVGRLLLKVSDAPNSQPPWDQRPLIQVTRTNTSRRYSLTQYGNLLLTSFFERDEEHREWVHMIASKIDQQNSNFNSKMTTSRSDSHPIREDLKLVNSALEEVL